MEHQPIMVITTPEHFNRHFQLTTAKSKQIKSEDLKQNPAIQSKVTTDNPVKTHQNNIKSYFYVTTFEYWSVIIKCKVIKTE